ncbi:MAG: hypothetical protein EAZ92_14390 [Candidatus Kapaibacterium sp.]|nr:MAG: hypothetical protein EAZ92_14390 [Candidatus Kapabacteria bacterium]
MLDAQHSLTSKTITMKATLQFDPSKKPLTPKQHEFLIFLKNFVEERGYPPTMKEMCDKMEMSSTNAANQYIQALEKKGYLHRQQKGASRGIQILDFTPRPRHISPTNTHNSSTMNHYTAPMHSAPIQGTSHTSSSAPLPASVKNVVISGEGTAAQPLSVFLSPRGQVKIDTEFFRQNPTSQLFCAVVSDDGMSNDAIRQGDTVLARQQFGAEEGEIVVALLHDMTIVRRFAAASNELIAGVRGFPPVPYSADSTSVKIIGVVIGLMRLV